ncbi:MAG: MFS transporter [Pseudomonadota bacterium]
MASDLAPERWTLRAFYTIVVLGLCAGTQMSDQGIQSLSLSSIQSSFGVSDAALGAVQGIAGFLVGSLLAIPLSRLVDRFSRKRILLCLIVTAASMMVVSALAPSFALFFLGRSSSGILEFAMIPLVYSMIPDLAPERDRVLANLGFAAIMAAGASGGVYFGGDILRAAEQWIPLPLEPWRKGFLLLSASGLPLLLLGLATLDPPRYLGMHDRWSSASLGAFVRRRWKLLALFMGVAGSMLIAVQALSQLIALAMERRFDAELTVIGRALGVILLVVSAGSIPMAGVLDRLLGRSLGYASRPAVMALGALTALPASVLLVSTSDLDQAFTAVGAFLLVTATANSLVPTMLQDVIPAPLRARGFAVWSFLVSVFSALGPLIAGVLSESVFNRNLLQAITYTVIPALVLSAGLAVTLVFMTLRSREVEEGV